MLKIALTGGIATGKSYVLSRLKDRGVATIGRNYGNSAKKGKLTAEQVAQRMALLTPSLDYAVLADADGFVQYYATNVAVGERVGVDEEFRPARKAHVAFIVEDVADVCRVAIAEHERIRRLRG